MRGHGQRIIVAIDSIEHLLHYYWRTGSYLLTEQVLGFSVSLYYK